MPPVLPAEEQLEQVAARVEPLLARIAGERAALGPPRLVKAIEYALLGGGKRLRPALVLAAAEAVGGDAGDASLAMRFALSLEMIHAYSLVHDDLPAMDDDDLRRGRPTCHKLFGEDTAILAGDALFAEAVQLVAEHQPGTAEVRVGILREISRATGVAGMVGGQYLDLKDAGLESPDALRRVHALKTGRLMSCAVHCALVLVEPPPAIDGALRRFAKELGLLFQIVDDILDVEGSEADLGKAVGADARQGKITYVSVHGLEEARRLAGEAYERALASLATLPGPVDHLVGITDLTFRRQH